MIPQRYGVSVYNTDVIVDHASLRGTRVADAASATRLANALNEGRTARGGFAWSHALYANPSTTKRESTMHTYTTPVRVRIGSANVAEGDLVRLTKGDSVRTGRARRADASALVVEGHLLRTGRATDWDIEVIERAADALPTAPGLYIAKHDVGLIAANPVEVFRLSSVVGWQQSGKDRSGDLDAALDDAKRAHKDRGGLVPLGVAL